MCKNLQQSLIARKHSTQIKGLLMLLIIIGHNAILMEHNGDFTLKSFLYSFHVWAFFILPFLYPIPTLSKEKIVRNAKRLLLPYTLLFVLFLIGYSILSHKTPEIKNTLLAFLSASQILLKDTIGFRLLWFLPTMFIVLLARDYYFYQNKYIRLLIIASCVLILIYSLIDSNNYWKVMHLMPFGLIYYHASSY